MDVKQVAANTWHVFSQGGSNDTEIEAIEWALSCEKLGAGEIVVNAIDTDGEKSGYNLALTKAIAEAVAIPVVASGGVGTEAHFAVALHLGNENVALVASVLHTCIIINTDYTHN